MSNENRKRVKEKEETLNQEKIEIDRKKWLINYLTNQPLSHTSSSKETVNEFQKLLNRCSDLCSVIYDKRKASVIFLLLKNKVTYFGQVKQMLGLNGGSIAFLLGSGEGENYVPGLLEKKGIIRRVSEKEFGQEKKILDRNRRSSHQIKHFFCLTDGAKQFYSNIPEELERLSEKANVVNRLHERMQLVERQTERANDLEARKNEAFNKLYRRIEEIKEKFAARKENNSLAEFKKELMKLRELEEFKEFPDLLRDRFRFYWKLSEEKWKQYLGQIRSKWEALANETNG
jgi:hypothetical protein